MSDMPEFKKFSSIPRYCRPVVITEKIDGTNAVVHVSDDGTVTAGSRNGWIGDKDNFGFRAWVMEHAEELRTLGPGYHYGEWWGAGIQRRYGLDHKRFSLFNVGRWHQHDKEPTPLVPNDPRMEIKFTTAAPKCCHVVPILYRGDISLGALGSLLHVNIFVELLKNGSVAAPGFDKPEGIVLYHEASGHLYKWTRDGDGHKGVKR